jgi:hypothetical protein
MLVVRNPVGLAKDGVDIVFRVSALRLLQLQRLVRLKKGCRNRQRSGQSPDGHKNTTPAAHARRRLVDRVLLASVPFDMSMDFAGSGRASKWVAAWNDGCRKVKTTAAPGEKRQCSTNLRRGRAARTARSDTCRAITPLRENEHVHVPVVRHVRAGREGGAQEQRQQRERLHSYSALPKTSIAWYRTAHWPGCCRVKLPVYALRHARRPGCWCLTLQSTVKVAVGVVLIGSGNPVKVAACKGAFTKVA